MTDRPEPAGRETGTAFDSELCVNREDVFVIVPVFNEASVLGGVLGELAALGYTVVRVDDGSSDDSWNVICELPVYGLRHGLNLGQGTALETGMEYARRQGAAIAVHFDADGQHAAEQIDSLIAPLRRGEADVVLGSRFLRATDTARIPPARRMLLRIGRIVTGVLNEVWLNDTHNGFRALSRRALIKIRLTERGYGHASQVLDEIRVHRLRYIESPVTISYSDYSLAKGPRTLDAFNVLLDVLLGKLFR